LQEDAWVSCPFAHVGALHCVLAPGKVQLARFMPSHVAAHDPVPGHAPREPTGAPTTGLHVPREAGESHASHCPLHAALQQTSSAQYVLAQSAFVAHAARSGAYVKKRPTTRSAITSAALS
jgi:hypothetical protein